jgi:hypothetical protein
MKNQTEIKVPEASPPAYKIEFLAWLNRFCRFPRDLRATFEKHHFTEEELNKYRPMIEQKYKLKVEYLGRRRGA